MYVKKLSPIGSYASIHARRTSVEDKISVRNIVYAHIASAANAGLVGAEIAMNSAMTLSHIPSVIERSASLTSAQVVPTSVNVLFQSTSISITITAQNKYSSDKLGWRTGPRKSEAEMKTIVKAFQCNIHKKQSIDTIIHTSHLNLSTSTAYRYIREHHIPGIANIDLKRQVRYIQRRSSRHHLLSIDYDFLEGRRYEDFLAALEMMGSDVNIWEMDTIIGKKGHEEKCVLSLLHRRSNLQLYFLLQHKDMFEVTYIFDSIKRFLGSELFRDTFTIILTDNGAEFRDPLSLETEPETGERLVRIYFARPRRSDDKGKCEKNHEHFREKVPKGYSMDSLTKHDINFISNQVNNYVRKQLNCQSPYAIAKLVLNEKALDLSRLHFISPKAVDLTPLLH